VQTTNYICIKKYSGHWQNVFNEIIIRTSHRTEHIEMYIIKRIKLRWHVVPRRYAKVWAWSHWPVHRLSPTDIW